MIFTHALVLCDRIEPEALGVSYGSQAVKSCRAIKPLQNIITYYFAPFDFKKDGYQMKDVLKYKLLNE